MKISNGVNKKQKIILATMLSILFFPMFVFADDWGVVVSSPNATFGFGSGSGPTSGGLNLSNPYGLPQGSILGIASNLLFWLLAIFAIIGVVGFVIAGIIYLVSTGDETAIARAKQAMLYSILGIIVGLSGFLIMQAIQMLLSGASSTF